MSRGRFISGSAPAWFVHALMKYPRIAIAGGPRTGKSTLAKLVKDRPVATADDWMRHEWDEVPGIAIDWAKNAGDSFVIEGVQTARALRKGLQVDAVIYLDKPHVEQSPGQAAMSKGVATIFAEWREGAPDLPVIRPTV